MYNVQWSPGVTLEQMERQVIETAYRFYKNNKSQTARALDIAIRTLETKLEKYAGDDRSSNANLDGVRQRREEFLKRERGLPAGVESVNGIDIGNARFDRPPEGEAFGDRPNQGVRMESAAHSAKEHEMPVSVGKKVQSMPSAHAAADRPRKSR